MIAPAAHPNPLRRLSALGQSVWLDFIRRDMLAGGGELERLIREDGLAGVTSNPAIFEKAIDGSPAYDEAIRDLGRQGRSAEAIFERLAVEDVARAADLFRPTYDATEGVDGMVSIEVSPRLALDPEGSVAEGHRLWEAVGRPNVMVKIPGTGPGLAAIGSLLREGINVNITLLFSVERHVEVHETYLTAMEERLREGLPVDRLRSVASFFLSRIDTLLDPEIEKIVAAGGPRADAARDLPGTTAIANAKVAYEKWRAALATPRWEALARAGVRPQRLLWASTSTKNPKYPDVHYVEPLIGPETINTMPIETLDAYRDHGRPAVRIGEGLSDAHRRLERLGQVGLDLPSATRRLEEEGVRKFSEPLEKLLRSIERKRAGVVSESRRP